MLRRAKQSRNASIPMYALGAIFLLPLTIGVLLVNSSASTNDHANQISRDLASMYAQGMDFSQHSNQNIAQRVAEGLGANIRGGQSVLILSKIRVVQESDCPQDAARDCANKGYPVVAQRYVVGNAALRTSSFGTPSSIETSTGNVRNWATDRSARAENFSDALKPGEVTYAAECYVTSPESHGGVYSRAMF